MDVSTRVIRKVSSRPFFAGAGGRGSGELGRLAELRTALASVPVFPRREKKRQNGEPFGCNNSTIT